MTELIKHILRRTIAKELRRRKPEYFRNGPVTEAAVDVAIHFIAEEMERSKSTLHTYIAGAEARIRELQERVAELEADVDEAFGKGYDAAQDADG